MQAAWRVADAVIGFPCLPFLYCQCKFMGLWLALWLAITFGIIVVVPVVIHNYGNLYLPPHIVSHEPSILPTANDIMPPEACNGLGYAEHIAAIATLGNPPQNLRI